MISRVSLCLMAVLLWSADFAAAQCSGWGAGPSKVSDLSKACSWALGTQTLKSGEVWTQEVLDILTGSCGSVNTKVWLTVTADFTVNCNNQWGGCSPWINTPAQRDINSSIAKLWISGADQFNNFDMHEGFCLPGITKTFTDTVANTPGPCVLDCPPDPGDNDGDPDLEEGGVCDTDPNCPSPLGSPIVVSGQGNRFQLTNAEGGVDFDLDNDGSLERVAWTIADSDESFLALDRNGNGLIDSGDELFGDFTEQPASNEPNGFLALAVFDLLERGGDENGAITPADAVFDLLLLWRDSNHDGISQPGELRSLADARIASLSLRYHEARRRDVHGNEFRYLALVTRDAPAASHLLAVDVFLVGAP